MKINQRKKITLMVIGLSLALTFSLNVRARSAVSGKEATGTFQHENGSTFDIKALGNNRLKVKFLGIYVYEVNGLQTANTGEAKGIANIYGDEGIFRPEGFEKDCTIQLKFLRPGILNVSQQGSSESCGFGRNVTAAGDYHKTKNTPKF